MPPLQAVQADVEAVQAVPSAGAHRPFSDCAVDELQALCFALASC